MNTIFYLIEANAYLVAFYALYRFLFQKETYYSINRIYLLGSSVISFIMPLITIGGLTDNVQMEYGSALILPVKSNHSFIAFTQFIYLLIVIFLLLRFASSLYGISVLVKNGCLKKINGLNIVELDKRGHSFSFMKYLFIHPDEQNLETIIRHEQVHIRQWHSADVLFLEFLRIINWFNPIIPIIQKEMKALHEYIADEESFQYESSPADYALFLINYSSGVPQNSLGNTMFNQSLLKKRIMKLHQKKSTRGAQLKYLLALLLIPVLLCITAASFAKSYGIIDLLPGDAVSLQDTIKKKLTIPPPPPPMPPKTAQSKLSNKTVIAPPPPPTSRYKNKQVVAPPPPNPPNSSRTNIGNKLAPPPPPMPPKSGESATKDIQAPPPPPAPPKATKNR